MADFSPLLESSDFEGAEEVLSVALAQADGRARTFIHFQFGRLYDRWNKLSSAMNHLNQAVEMTSATDEILMIQVIEELRRIREKQQLQTP